ncbi:MAG TPA: HU family DNA-binding protein [Spirochaetia bacterium]|nr:HU family DNA-binding protein [Spirochaetia bacterium]
MDDGGISKPIRAHLEALVRSSGLPDTEETFQRMSAAWLSKKSMFEGQARALDMEELSALPAGDARGVLLLTWSGSLVSLEPPGGAGRRGEYASIEMRTDVPGLVLMEGVDFPHGLALDREAEFSAGPVRKTSALLKIAACRPELPTEEQARRIREATIYLTNGFVKINRTVTAPGTGFPELMNVKSMIAYLAEKNGLSKKRARQLIEDYHLLLQSGILLGQRVPLGKLGRLFLREQPARKARVGVNPSTGQKITIAARPPQAVPRMTFSKVLKDRAKDWKAS